MIELIVEAKKIFFLLLYIIPCVASAQLNADKAVIIKNSEISAGSGDRAGGLGATATTALGPRGALHELLHAFGFADEYMYTTEKEANLYCMSNQNGFNVAYFAEEAPYASDVSARSRHSEDIPWFNKIKSEVLITTIPNLGTPEPNKFGLYRANNCANATTGIKAWKPGDSKNNSIMASLDGEIPKSFFEYLRVQLGENEPMLKQGPLEESDKTGPVSGAQ
jgi:hypothetical protein